MSHIKALFLAIICTSFFAGTLLVLPMFLFYQINLLLVCLLSFPVAVANYFLSYTLFRASERD